MPLMFSEPAEAAYSSPLTIRHLLNGALITSGAQEIIYRDQCRYSYQEFNKRIGRLASFLSGLGADEGMTIAMMDWDSHRYLKAYFAIPMMGALDFDYPLDNGGSINAHIDYLKKERYGLEFNDAPQFESETDGLVNGSVGLTLASGWEFSLWGQNLTDEDIVLYGNDTWFAFYDFAADESVQTATSMPRYAPPRTYGATVRYSF